MDYMTGFHCKYIEDAERIARKLNPTDYHISKSTDENFPHYVRLYFNMYSTEWQRMVQQAVEIRSLLMAELSRNADVAQF
jgi:hypothetical protein